MTIVLIIFLSLIGWFAFGYAGARMRYFLQENVCPHMFDNHGINFWVWLTFLGGPFGWLFWMIIPESGYRLKAHGLGFMSKFKPKFGPGQNLQKRFFGVK